MLDGANTGLQTVSHALVVVGVGHYVGAGGLGYLDGGS